MRLATSAVLLVLLAGAQARRARRAAGSAGPMAGARRTRPRPARAASAGPLLKGKLLLGGALANKTAGLLDALSDAAAGTELCYPKWNSPDVSLPMKACPEGFSANGTALCVKSTQSTATTCVRATACPAGMASVEHEKLCLAPEARSCLVGVLVAAKVNARLPLMILPALKQGLAAAAEAKAALKRVNLSLPAFTPAANISLPEVTLTLGPKQHPLDTNLSAALDTSGWVDPLLSATQEFNLAVTGSDDVMAVLSKAMALVNVTELMNIMPALDAWVSKHVENVTNVNEITAQVSAGFPTCLHKCCRDEARAGTTLALPSAACPAGKTLHAVLKVCVSDATGYEACPAGSTRCTLPPGLPACVGGNATLHGLDACKTAALLQAKLPKRQC
ncbi:hypothetical protein HT031_004290 [Scenedesmus sp. PABB004]|nr:hypothetical protein HT031_004290 [Scenedesmus sp. PABB004]